MKNVSSCKKLIEEKINKINLSWYNEPGINIVWIFTNACNLNCPYCTVPKFSTKTCSKNNLIFYSILKKEAKKINFPIYVDIEGGEPTIDKNVFKLKSENNLYFKLFTNFYKPDINNLIQFSKHSFIELSLHSYIINNTKLFQEYLSNLEIFLKKANLKNISLSVLVDTNNDRNIYEKVCEKLLKYKNEIDIFFSFAENNNSIYNNFNYKDYKDLITFERLKFNFKGYLCDCNYLEFNCSELIIKNCSKNFFESIYKLNLNKIFKQKFICKNEICGIHDNQIIYKKIRINNDI